MLRAVILSLLVLFSVALMLPLAESSAHNARNKSSWSRRGHRRHSRAWWRRYRARMRNKRAIHGRARTLSRRPASSADTSNVRSDSHVALPNVVSTAGGTYRDPDGSWSLTVPQGWSSRPVASGGGLTFRFFAPGNRAAGQATLSVVASANQSVNNALSLRAQRRMIGGVSFTDLYRTVINKMVGAGGWVNNDLVREIGGQRVYVVLAQTPASGDGQTPPQAWTFYFAEMDGRIYGLAAGASAEFSERMMRDSAEIIASFRSSNRSTLAAATAQNH